MLYLYARPCRRGMRVCGAFGARVRGRIRPMPLINQDRGWTDCWLQTHGHSLGVPILEGYYVCVLPRGLCPWTGATV